MRSRQTAAGLVAALALLTLAGCGANPARRGGDSEAAAPGKRAPAGDSGNVTGKAEGSAPGGTGSSSSTTGKRVAIQRARILTADLTVRAKNVNDVGDIADRAITLVRSAGGEVAGDRRSQDGSRTQADVILKVPPAKYADILDRLADLGQESQRSAQAEDVTDEVVDVASRVSSQTASVERVRKLLASARTLGEIVQIEGELARRQADLESLKARQRALDARTADATITLHVQAPHAPAKRATDKRGFLTGLDAGWTALTASVTVLLTVLGAMLPFLVVGALLLGGVVLALRRWRQEPGDGTSAAGAAPPA